MDLLVECLGRGAGEYQVPCQFLAVSAHFVSALFSHMQPALHCPLHVESAQYVFPFSLTYRIGESPSLLSSLIFDNSLHFLKHWPFHWSY